MVAAHHVVTCSMTVLMRKTMKEWQHVPQLVFRRIAADDQYKLVKKYTWHMHCSMFTTQTL